MIKRNLNKDYNTVRESVHIINSCSCPVSYATETGFYFSLNTQLLQEVGYKPMAFYLKLKSYYRNSTIYDYSLRKIARLAGCSTTLAKKNIELLKSHGLIEFHSGNLTLKSLREFNETKRGIEKVLISNKYTLQEYKDKLLLILLKRKIKQQTYTIVKSKRKERTKGNTCKTSVLLAEISDKDMAIGMDKLSEYLNISKSTLSLWVKKMEMCGKLKRISVKENLGKLKINNDYFNEGYVFVNKLGQSILFFGSVYTFL